jgi:aerobic-type carbon monoxide dehydrogenase small subunit (CoxS/CutS family)
MAANTKDGLTRRELLQGLSAGAVATGLLPARTARAGAAIKRTGAGAETYGPGPVAIRLRVNGAEHALEVEPRTTLLTALRAQLDLTGAKPVCDRGACGACTVHLSGTPVLACMTLAFDAIDHEVTTVEGLAQGGELHPVQEAFIAHDALQCGFCTPGMVMSCAALLGRNPHPNEHDVRNAIAGNLCRCGTYPQVIAATLAAAGGARHG